jgi:hypothetical protein
LFRGLDHGNLVHRPGVSKWKIADYVVGDKQAAVIPGANDVDDRVMVLTMTMRTVETMMIDDQTGRRTVRLSR